MGFGNGLAPKSALIKWRDCYFLPDFFRALVPAVLEYESDGVSTIDFNQGYRFRGQHIPDYGIGQSDHTTSEAKASTTTTGDANQEYEAGHATIPGMPSAAVVGESNHGDPEIGALDNNASNPARRQAIFPKYGFKANIDGETWHWAKVLTPTVAIPTLEEALVLAGLVDNSEDGEGNMAFTPEAEADLDRRFSAVTDKINALGVAVQLLVGLPENQQQFIAQITDAYQRNLGRGPDQAGLFGYLGLMVNQHWTIQQVDAAMSGSDEALGNQIAAWYRDPAILNRAPSPSEIQGWVSWLHANNQPLSAVRDQLIGSDEYKHLHP